jgi:hypothetical protein
MILQLLLAYPEECLRLTWENVAWLNGRNGVVLIPRGKTAAARRVILMTSRVRAVLETRWEMVGKPEDGWVWPAPTRSGHIEPFESTEAARQGVQNTGRGSGKEKREARTPVRAVFTAAYIPDTFRRVRVRCVDAGANRRARLYHNFLAIRSSFRGRRFRRDVEISWAQNWAQRK